MYFLLEKSLWLYNDLLEKCKRVGNEIAQIENRKQKFKQEILKIEKRGEQINSSQILLHIKKIERMI